MRTLLPSLLGILFLAFLMALPASADSAPLSLDEGWEYRWGDSPFQDDGTPAWVNDPPAQGEWQPIAFPSNPPVRGGSKHAWFRITLPEGEWRDPVLYIYSVDLITQAWLEDELIYQHGHFDDRGEGRFAGWPWHMISLPEAFAGKTLYFRVFSDYTDIGLWGEVKLMERLDLLRYILERSAADLIVSAFLLLLALLASIFALVQGNRRSFFGIGLFSLASGIMLLAETQASQLLLDIPLLWDYLAAVGYYTLPVAMGLMLEHWFAAQRPILLRRIWQLHLGYLVLAPGLALAGIIDLSSTFPTFDALLLVTLLVMFTTIVVRLDALNAEQKLIITSYGLFALLLLVDMAVAHGLLPWRRVPVSGGALGFALAIVMISLWHYRHIQRELHRLNLSLEKQVAERTGELEHMVETLQAYSYQDALTGLHNRRYFDELLEHEAAVARRQGTSLTLAMIDIDHFKQFNDREGHEAGDTVLVGVGRVLSHHFRDADVVCRMGGEEFVIIMPGATSASAEARLAELLEILSRTHFRHRNRELGPLTISCGIATYPEHAGDPLTLIGLADKALYSAKHRGRARIEIYA
ncbi:sensor domain-containing diguanylate cyclase [Halomonas daqiaonensis]|uniref:diguanylate cyclase n=1 Tax=Halomonas daqiaonensis TaxID=650850 RepID=A0A1H7F4E9_9GAMM|nr:GGDEF domain-containing protein [Halomonas daqiaonensis]SEK20971.1 diguanylate cyclase (GGDEF) domain-containing protein [Halomonas daqiaonensis]